MYENIDGLRLLRNSFFELAGKKRWKRVALIALFIALVWCFADWISGNLKPNLWHDFICLVMAVIIERFIPWGK